MPAPVPDLAGKRCFITGAASGIGRATALGAARRGADLYLTDRAVEGLEETAEAVRATGGQVTWTGTADVGDHAAIVAIAEEIHAAHGSMDVVMNVAGISIWGAIENLDHDHWRRANEIDLMGPISVLECFVPPMIEPAAAATSSTSPPPRACSACPGTPPTAPPSSASAASPRCSASTSAGTGSASAWSAREG